MKKKIRDKLENIKNKIDSKLSEKSLTYTQIKQLKTAKSSHKEVKDRLKEYKKQYKTCKDPEIKSVLKQKIDLLQKYVDTVKEALQLKQMFNLPRATKYQKRLQKIAKEYDKKFPDDF